MRRGLVLVLLAACGGRTGLGHGGGAASDAGADGAACRAEIVASDPAGANALAVDGDDVFWGTVDGLVEKRNGGVVTVLAGGASTGVDAIAVDSSRVYYTTTGELHSVPRSGGSPTVMATQLGQPFALALDAATGSLYLLDYGAGIAAGRLLRVDTDGSVALLMTGLDVPHDLALDAAVYVTADAALLGNQLVEGVLLRVPKQGGMGAALATGLHSPMAVAVLGGVVYFVEQLDAQQTEHGGLRSIPTTGGGVTPIVATPGVLPMEVFVDETGAYLTTFSGPSAQNEATLQRVALDGTGSMTELAATPGVGYGYVRTSPTAVYWTINWTAGHPPSDGASLRKLCK